MEWVGCPDVGLYKLSLFVWERFEFRVTPQTGQSGRPHTSLVPPLCHLICYTIYINEYIGDEREGGYLPSRQYYAGKRGNNRLVHFWFPLMMIIILIITQRNES
jgi:hypothetical protein